MTSSSVHSRRSSGFTLLELMIVVVIVGVLSAAAIPRFMIYQLRSKTAEVKANIGAIATAERAYASEYGGFVSIPMEPAAIPGTQTAAFNPATGFDLIGFEPEGNVYFSYGVQAAADGSGFTADAGADIDGNGVIQYWGHAKLDSGNNPVPAAVGCNAANLTPDVLGPCDPTAGQTTF